MINRSYAYAIRAMGTLEMYWEMESGRQKYQEELKRILATLRDGASTMGTVGEQMDKNSSWAFLMSLSKRINQVTTCRAIKDNRCKTTADLTEIRVWFANRCL